jgi:adenine-specific DNA-methyltransferase
MTPHGTPTIRKITASDPLATSADVVAENIARLKALFPELVTEGPDGAAVNVDVLKALVGDKTVTDADEKYGLNWHGKRRARQLALTPSTGTLRPCPQESVDWDTTQNLMIEGDNLEVLKLLQKSYAGKVKLIYIDPPYNTGKDFVYPDDFQDNIKNYLELTGQVEGGRKISSNTEASGRFHTDWINMMYPRLKAASLLLRRDGALVVSIDDGELSNLLALCNEVFGEENHVATFVWEKKRKASNLDSQVRSITEYVVCYRREMTLPLVASDDIAEDNKPYPFYNTGNKRAVLSFPADYITTSMADGKYPAGRYEDNKTYVDLLDDVVVRDGRVVTAFRAEGEWRYSQAALNKLVAAGESIVLKGERFKPYFINNSARQKFVKTLLTKQTYGVGTNEDGNAEIANLFGDNIFSFPKPVSLIQKLVELVQDPDAIVMDFFAGSGTTGHAVMAQNAADGGNRQYILVQLPEPLDPENNDQKVAADFCDKLGKPRTIAELTKERLRRAAKKIKEENPLFTGDLGFRVFKLDSSNIREWEPSREDIAESLEAHVENLRTDCNEQDILYELLLKRGLDLCVPIETKTIAGKTVHSVGAGSLIACLDTTITRAGGEALAMGIAQWHKSLNPAGETVVIFRDDAFADDVVKTNVAAILEQHGLKNVRSL